LRYFLQKLSQFLIVFFLVTFGVLILMRLGLNAPGDPARTLLGGTADQQLIAETTEKYHLDRNYFVQYFYFIKGLVTGDMGFSVQYSTPVSTYIKQRAMTTILIGLYAITIALLIAVPTAVRAAYKRDSWFDKSTSAVAFALLMPAIVLAVLLKFAFIETWQLFPRIGEKVYPWDDPGAHFKNFFLPTMTLALPLAAVFTRLLRSDMVMTLQQDFITLASAKGVSPRRVLWSHALRNSLFSLITSVGVQLGALIGGAVVAETFFDLDGMGSMLVVSILAKDLFTVQSTAAILVASVVVVNLLIDLLYAVVDPRIRQARALA
jgi:peptide/nickel transport system permease protein